VLTRSRVFLRRRAGLLLALAAVLLLGSWVGVEQRDDGWVLVLGGRTLDPMGKALTAWTRWSRDCAGVQAVAVTPSADPVFGPSLQALREFSPPDSASAEVLQMQALGPWRLIQARFDRLEPVVVVVLQESSGARVIEQAVWSGSTQPWDAAWRIRRFIVARAPEVPRRLLDCLEPDAVFERPSAWRP